MSTTAPPLRIAMVSYYLPSGSKIGVGYQVHELATELTRRGHHVDVYSECPPVPGAIYGHRHIAVTGRFRTFRFAAELRKVDFRGYDVLHAHGDDYWLWKRRAPRHIRTMHGSCFSEALRVPGAANRIRMVLLGVSEIVATLVADQTVLVSPGTRRWYPWVREVIPNGVDTTRFAPGPPGPASDPTVLFVGTWQNRKRGRDLAEAFSRDVLPALPNARLEMVCRDAPDNPGRGIHVLGELSDADLAAAYRRAWVFCLPSSYEGFGIPYAEAMATGIPVLATPNVGARYVTDNGRVGRLTRLEHLGAALLSLLRDGVERDRLSRAALDRAGEFSLARVADQYEALYRESRRARNGRRRGRLRGRLRTSAKTAE
jgi:glycosyltransferase involved in cell wall biosynthesis